LVKDLGTDVNQVVHGVTQVTALLIAAQEGRLAVVQCSVEELGADVNQAAGDGRTPLFLAAERGSLQVVQCLGNFLGADVNQSMKNGGTAL
jgi:ankyrin repeat protein